MMPRLLAHEFGHLLGSDHDGDVAKYVCCCQVALNQVQFLSPPNKKMAQLLGGNQSACLPIVVHLVPMYRNPHSIYKTQSRVPCPQGQSLMSPTVGAFFYF